MAMKMFVYKAAFASKW